MIQTGFWKTQHHLHLFDVLLFTWALFIPWQPESSLRGTNYPLLHRGRQEQDWKRWWHVWTMSQKTPPPSTRPALIKPLSFLHCDSLYVVFLRWRGTVCRIMLKIITSVYPSFGSGHDRNLNRDTQRSFEMSGWRPSPIVLCSVIKGLILRWNVHRSPPEMEEWNKSALPAQTLGFML